MTIAIFGRQEHQASTAARSTGLASKRAMLLCDHEQVVDIRIGDCWMQRTLRFPIGLEQGPDFVDRTCLERITQGYGNRAERAQGVRVRGFVRFLVLLNKFFNFG